MTSPTTTDDFVEFVRVAEPRLRRALAAAYGPLIGREAALDALSWGWEHWDRLSGMSNPVGYLYRVGQTRAGRHVSYRAQLAQVNGDDASDPPEHTDFEPELPAALRTLTEQQRTAAVLVHGYGVPLREAAELMEVSVATVRKHCERAMKHLRAALEVSDVG
jgi:RNA polymerase sigma-70 factor (ECF subfamily)